MGDGFTSPPRKACCGFFRPKNPTASAEASMLTTRPPKPLDLKYGKIMYSACTYLVIIIIMFFDVTFCFRYGKSVYYCSSFSRNQCHIFVYQFSSLPCCLLIALGTDLLENLTGSHLSRSFFLILWNPKVH